MKSCNIEERQRILNTLVDKMHFEISFSKHRGHFIFAGFSGDIFDIIRKFYDGNDLNDLLEAYQIERRHLIAAMASDIRFEDVTDESCRISRRV